MQPLTDEQIYDKYNGKTENNLNNIIHKIDNFEINCREKNNDLEYLKKNKAE